MPRTGRTLCAGSIRVWLAVVALFSLSGPASAQSLNSFMRVDGVAGESTDSRHKNWIELISYSQTIGTKACARVVVLKNLDHASPGLVTFAASSQVVPSVVVEMIRVGSERTLVFRATLEQVIIGQTEIVEQDLASVVEKVVLLPRTVRLSYFPQDATTGAPGPEVTSLVTCR